MAAVMMRSVGVEKSALYGGFMGIYNPGEHQHVDRSGLGAQQRPRAGVNRGAGGQDIVDQDHAAAMDQGLSVGGDLERALHIAGALLPRQADLLLGQADAPERFG